MTGLIGVSIGTAGVSMDPGPGVSDEPQGLGVEGGASAGDFLVETASLLPADPAAGQSGILTVT